MGEEAGQGGEEGRRGILGSLVREANFAMKGGHMRKLAILSVLFVSTLSAFAATHQPKNELGLTGEFVQTSADGPNPYTLNVDLLIPVGGGAIMVGPAVGLSDDDALVRLGGSLEWNLVSDKAGFFIGASAFYFLKEVDDVQRHTLLGKAGLKIPVGSGAAVKVYAFDVLDGRGQDDTDLGVAAGIIARFGPGPTHQRQTRDRPQNYEVPLIALGHEEDTAEFREMMNVARQLFVSR